MANRANCECRGCMRAVAGGPPIIHNGLFCRPMEWGEHVSLDDYDAGYVEAPPAPATVEGGPRDAR